MGGTVSGMRTGDAVVLQNGADTISVPANGRFTFPTVLNNGASYDVRVQTPPGYSCRVANNAGTIDGADVTKVGVDCFPFVLAGKPAMIQQAGGGAVDGAGNAYVLDIENHVVLKLDASGKATVLAGSPGLAGYRDGKGGEARFHFSGRSMLALDSSGNLGIADSCNAVIRKMTPDGVVTTLSGVPTNLCKNYQKIGEMPQVADGDAKTARFGQIFALASDRAGGFYVADFDWIVGVRHVMPNGRVVSVRWPITDSQTDTQYLTSLVVDSKGAIWFGDDKRRVWKFVPGGKPTYIAGKWHNSLPGVDLADGQGSDADFNAIDAMTVDAADNIYVGDSGSVRKVTPAGYVSTVAGSYLHMGSVDGVGKSAQLGSVKGISTDGNGTFMFTEWGSTTLRKMSADGSVSTIEATLSRGYVDGVGDRARLNSSAQPAVDSAGNVYLTDPVQNVVRKMTPDGTVSLFAGMPGVRGALDGPLASATFDRPSAIAAGPGDVLYLLDGFSSRRLRRIVNGVVSTVVPQIGYAYMFDLAIDRDGNVAVSGEAVWGITPSGEVSLLADYSMLAKLLGPDEARMFTPQGIAYDAAGNLYISDTGTAAIYKLSKAGEASIFAGTPTVEGDEDGPVGKATFGYYGVDQMTIDDKGNLYLSGQGKLRKISPSGVASTLDLAWGNPNIHGLVWRNGKLYGMTRYAALQIFTP
ncbi:hypothetical protein GCM10027320_20220 [Massilia solisilvae]